MLHSSDFMDMLRVLRWFPHPRERFSCFGDIGLGRDTPDVIPGTVFVLREGTQMQVAGLHPLKCRPAHC